ncbi:hypothetical protein BSL78_20027 [Apostichopus japonicus]|uniref:Ig-like domain-containing protein n=1 Tax=Stichopus japonicus TaxID=307972 RepID=A0A2G8K5A7_STIJA|nr:hypothetical protein BSL78_20027 [Apostichopus japonicus]
MNGYTINLQIEITDGSRSSFTCLIFDDGNFVSQEEINFDVRSRDELVCLLSKGPNVMVGDTLEVGCYGGHSQPATSVEWTQTKVNGTTDEDLPSITSDLINQFKRKTSASLTVTAEDNGSIFHCTATAPGGTRQCMTEVLSIVDDITVSFVPSIASGRLEVGQTQEVRCIPSVSTASVMWQHDYTESETVTVVPLDSSLRIMINKPTGLSDGAILSFECTATLGSLRASATFELVVGLVHSTTTTSPSRTTSKTSEEVSEDTEDSEDTEETEGTEGMAPKNGDSGGGIFDSPITLYLVIGGSLAAILIIVIIIILIAICRTHTNTPKTKRKRDERSIDNISYVEDNTDDDPSVSYSAVSKANPARIVSSPDVVPYSDVNKRHVLIDEDEIYDESQNWWKAEEL